MQNWLVVAKTSTMARQLIEENGGSIEVIHDDHPHLELITLVNALYRGVNEEYGPNRWELNRQTHMGVALWEKEDPTTRTMYAWNMFDPHQLRDPEF